MKKSSDKKFKPLLTHVSDMVCTLEDIRINLSGPQWQVKLADGQQSKINELIKKWTFILSETNQVLNSVMEEMVVCEKFIKGAA